MNRLIHRTWGEKFLATIYKTQEAQTPVDITSFILSMGFLGDKSWKGNFFGSKSLLVAWLLLRVGKGGLGDREHGTHGSFQPLKGGLFSRHGRHNNTSLLGGLQ